MTLTLTLAVADLEATAGFYGDLLGLPLEEGAPGGGFPMLLWLRCGDAVVLVRDEATLRQRHPAHFDALDRHPRGNGLMFELPVTDLARRTSRCERAGVRILYELDDTEHDRRELWLHDPDGYLVVLFEEGPLV